MSVDEEEFLTAAQIELYGKFGAPPTDLELERFFFLDDGDRKLIAKRRDDATKLGFSLQLTTVRFLGTFLANPIDVPVVVMAYVAAQLEIEDASAAKAYRHTSRETRRAWNSVGDPAR